MLQRIIPGLGILFLLGLGFMWGWMAGDTHGRDYVINAAQQSQCWQACSEADRNPATGARRGYTTHHAFDPKDEECLCREHLPGKAGYFVFPVELPPLECE